METRPQTESPTVSPAERDRRPASRRLHRPVLVSVVALSAAFFGLSSARGPEVQAADHNDPRRVQSTEFWNTTSTEGADPAADIADLFAWNRQAVPGVADPLSDTLVLALTWRVNAEDGSSLDDTVRFGIHIDNGSLLTDGDGEAEYDVWIRHGQNRQGGWAVKVENLPGVEGAVVAPVGETVEVHADVGAYDGTTTVLSGLFDDPFVFDFDGFFYGLSVGQGNPSPEAFHETQNPRPDGRQPGFQLQPNRPFGFNNKNDTIAGINVHAVVIEMPLRLVLREKKVGGGFKNFVNVWSTSSRPAQ
jgi:hypothetical protein